MMNCYSSYFLSVIIPVYNGGETLDRCLISLKRSVRLPDEIIVVDDASTDGSCEIAETYQGTKVIRLEGNPQGQAFARNRGADVAKGNILIFIDADVAVHSDTIHRIERHFIEEPEINVLFGSYDTNPPDPGLVSRYKNLFHHYVHQHGNREAVTFSSGCGAIQREVFQAMHGFDESFLSIEDIELGYRLHKTGYSIRLCPDVQVAHLKRWTLRSMLRSDIFDRAVPWTRLIFQYKNIPNDLNLNMKSRLSSFLLWIGLVCFMTGFWVRWTWFGCMAAVGAVTILNRDLYLFFRKNRGRRFGIAAIFLHQFYLFYSSLVFGIVWIGEMTGKVITWLLNKCRN